MYVILGAKIGGLPETLAKQSLTYITRTRP